MKFVREKVELFLHFYGMYPWKDLLVATDASMKLMYYFRSLASSITSLVLHNVGRPTPLLWWTLPVSRNTGIKFRIQNPQSIEQDTIFVLPLLAQWNIRKRRVSVFCNRL